MSDLIDREFIKRLGGECIARRDRETGELIAITRIDLLPSAQPMRKKGKWNWIGFNIECSVCGCMPCFDSTEPLYNFCPNCGADMRGET